MFLCAVPIKNTHYASIRPRDAGRPRDTDASTGGHRPNTCPGNVTPLHNRNMHRTPSAPYGLLVEAAVNRFFVKASRRALFVSTYAL